MTPSTAPISSRRDTAVRGNASLWALVGALLFLIGLVGRWWFLVFIGIFMVVPALLMLLQLRRARIRSGEPPHTFTRERS
ncbi:hypothetical protein ACMYYO_10920 [Dermacoccaceae bacterium W4C1]